MSPRGLSVDSACLEAINKNFKRPSSCGVQRDEKELTCSAFEGLASNGFIQTAPKPVNGIYMHFNVSGLFDLRSPWKSSMICSFDWLMEGNFATDVKDNVVCDSVCDSPAVF